MRVDGAGTRDLCGACPLVLFVFLDALAVIGNQFGELGQHLVRPPRHLFIGSFCGLRAQEVVGVFRAENACPLIPWMGHRKLPIADFALTFARPPRAFQPD